MRERAQKHGIALEIDVAPELGTSITADERKFKQILLNLLSNAVKFTPDGGRIDVHRAPRCDDAIEVAVRDTGIGIAPQDQEAVFEEFRQVGTRLHAQVGRHRPGPRAHQALRRAARRAHRARQRTGPGSTFMFTIPDGAGMSPAMRCRPRCTVRRGVQHQDMSRAGAHRIAGASPEGTYP